jgi:hypothetical protein
MSVDRQMSQRKQVKSALERIEALESTLPQVISGVNQAFNNFDQNLSSMKELLEALVHLTGETQVQSVVESTRELRAKEQAAAMESAVKQAVQEGRLVPTETIGEKSLVVGKETKADGTVLGAGRTQLAFSSVKQEFREALSGKGVGFVMDLPEGAKFEVFEVYNFVDPKVETKETEGCTSCEGCPAACCPTPEG